uniref:P-type domain-containing protein n=1 Tax=Stegastes partitus TaxID=144197 RepID=A0A3B5B6G3_9TELE
FTSLAVCWLPLILSTHFVCNIERALRINCGPRSISSDTCNKLGCCYDALDLTCFYKLNDCFAYPVSRHSVWTLLYDG